MGYYYKTRGNYYSLDGLVTSSFYKASLTIISEHKSYEPRFRGLHQWEKFLGVDSLEKVVSIILQGQAEFEDFNKSGIAYEFSKLKNEKAINDFANKYGLLGFSTPDAWDTHRFFKLRPSWGEGVSLLLKPGFSYCEPLEVWFFYINQVRKILKLYRALINTHKGEMDERDIEGNLLNIGWLRNGKYMVEWWDGTVTGCKITEETAEEGNFLKIAREVLISSVSDKSKTINNFASNIVETGKPPLGFTIQESKYTNFLLNAIYYDIWELISKNEPVHICANPSCKLPFKKVKRQQYCSNACKQEAYRIRKGK